MIIIINESGSFTTVLAGFVMKCRMLFAAACDVIVFENVKIFVPLYIHYLSIKLSN